MFIDTHLHLSKNEGISPELFIKNAENVGCQAFIVSCCSKESIIEGIKLAHQFDHLYLAVGFHPEEVEKVSEEDLLWLAKIIEKEKRIVAIGEIGLDYHYTSDFKEQMRTLFEQQLQLAEKYHLPVVIHTREAIQETYDILKKYSLKGSIHCFSGSVEMAESFIRLGYFLGIGGVVTFSNSKLYQVVEKVGLSSILLETDSPYLAQSPYRGKTNHSDYLPDIIEKLAEVLHVSSEEVEKTTTKNAILLFDLPMIL